MKRVIPFVLCGWSLAAATPEANAQDSTAQVQQLRQQVQALRQLAGLTPLTGPGIVLELRDKNGAAKKASPFPVGLVHDYDLLQAVNQLRAANAQGIAINGIRLTNYTAIRCIGPTIYVGKQAITLPCKIEVIGDPQVLERTLKVKGGLLTYFQLSGPDIRLSRATRLQLPAASSSQSFQNSIASDREPQVDLSSPEKTIRTFLDTLNKASSPHRPLTVKSPGHEERAASCVFGSHLNALTAEQKHGVGGANFNGSISNLRVALQGDEATATFVTTRRWTNSKKESGKIVDKEHLQLRRRTEGWKILPTGVTDSPLKREQLTPLLREATRLSHLEAASQVLHLQQCGHSLKGLCLGTDVFLQKHQGKFAMNGRTFMPALLPYTASKNEFYCPADKSGKVTYSFNTHLTNVARRSIVEPEKLVMIYEGKNGQLDFRHNGHALVGFTACNVRLVNREEAKSLRWTP